MVNALRGSSLAEIEAFVSLRLLTLMASLLLYSASMVLGFTSLDCSGWSSYCLYWVIRWISMVLFKRWFHPDEKSGNGDGDMCGKIHNELRAVLDLMWCFAEFEK